MTKIKAVLSPEIAKKVLVKSGLKRPQVVACIPAYNEERSIGPIILRVRDHVDRILVCDDGSTDMTAEMAEGLGATVIRHDRNRGKGAAMRTLFELARDLNPDVVVVLDADSQHNPADIPKVVVPVVSGEADLVIGSRFVDGVKSDAPLYRRFGQWLFNSSSNRNSTVKDTQSGFRAYSPKVLDAFILVEADGFGVESEQIDVAVKKGMRIKEVPIQVNYDGVEHPSKKHPLWHGTEIISTLLRLVTEERPLLLLGVPSAISVLVGFSAGLYVLWEYNRIRYFSLPFALISLAGVGLGMFLGVAALILYAINRLKPKV